MASSKAAGTGQWGRKGGAISLTAKDLEALLPRSLPGGFARKQAATAGSGGPFGYVSTKVEYANEQASITLGAADIGLWGALAGITSAFGGHAAREQADSYSRMDQVDGRLTLENYIAPTKASAYATVVKNRIMLTAEGKGASMDEIKAAIGTIDLAQVEALAER
jgi:hypothetical protein